MKRYQNPFRTLTRSEWLILIGSLFAVTLSFVLNTERDTLTFIATLIGVVALIFLAKGDVLGQALIVIFAVLYAIVSWRLRYYGEVITYVGMSAPIALISVVSWLRHPSASGHNEVEIAHVKARTWCVLVFLTVAVTLAFYFLLRHFGTANLIPSTISVATSFFAASLTFLRSPYYGLGYAANDVVLILLWVLASVQDVKYLPMVLCFVTFLVNDLYGFFNWRRILARQKAD